MASTVVLKLWEVFSSKPIDISVETTNFPLAEFPFPAVTLCPKNRINTAIAMKYLSRFVNIPGKLKHTIIKNVLAALYLLRYPNYDQMKIYLKMSRKYLKNFDGLNMTDFMLSVLPNCNEFLNECLWHGKKLNCCEIFVLQRTEEGFCYSFNSFTTDDKKSCLYNYEDDEMNNKEEDEKCKPQYLTFSGIYSGLSIFAKHQEDSSKYFLAHQKNVPGILVILTAAYDFPEAGIGTLLRTINGESIEIAISPSMLHSTQKLSRIAKEDRECTLHNESGLYRKHYSKQSCLIACREDFIARMCGCQLYFFYGLKISSFPLCKVSQLLCIVRYADVLKMNSPSKYAFKKPIIKDFPDCNCENACDGTWLELVIKRRNISELMGRNVTGHLDIFYPKYGAIKYERKLSFSRENLIVSLGGVVNLFLGASFISAAEVLYYFTRSVCIMIYLHIIKIGMKNSIFASPTEFIN